jgi:hypothetical protein
MNGLLDAGKGDKSTRCRPEVVIENKASYKWRYNFVIFTPMELANGVSLFVAWQM